MYNLLPSVIYLFLNYRKEQDLLYAYRPYQEETVQHSLSLFKQSLNTLIKKVFLLLNGSQLVFSLLLYSMLFFTNTSVKNDYWFIMPDLWPSLSNHDIMLNWTLLCVVSLYMWSRHSTVFDSSIFYIDVQSTTKDLWGYTSRETCSFLLSTVTVDLLSSLYNQFSS